MRITVRGSHASFTPEFFSSGEKKKTTEIRNISIDDVNIPLGSCFLYTRWSVVCVWVK